MRQFCHDEMIKNDEVFYIEMNKILKEIWKIKPELEKKYKNELKRKIPHNNGYVAIHVRRGDKIHLMEDRKYEITEYVDALLKLPLKTKVIFLMSDDYSAYMELKEKLPAFEIITFLNEKQLGGYDHTRYLKLPKREAKKRTIQLITEIEIAKNSDFFIGTLSSNIFKLVLYSKLINCIDISQKKEI